MDAKLRIDLSQGILEVEGSEKFVDIIYQDFKQNLLSKTSLIPSATPNMPSKFRATQKHKGSVEHSKKKSAVTTKTPSLVKDLDLLGKGKAQSLKTFVGVYTPKSAMEWNLLFVYYLQKILEVDAIGVDHIYTCYKHVNIKSPTHLYQSLVNTAHKKGSINTTSVDAITVTIVGENSVEHEMPKNDQPE